MWSWSARWSPLEGSEERQHGCNMDPPSGHVNMRPKPAALTENGPRRDRFSVEPERHLGQDDGHKAGHVRLDDKVANLPLQVKVGHHHRVLSWRKTNHHKGYLVSDHKPSATSHSRDVCSRLLGNAGSRKVGFKLPPTRRLLLYHYHKMNI